MVKVRRLCVLAVLVLLTACGGSTGLPEGLNGTWRIATVNSGGYDGLRFDDGWFECLDTDGSTMKVGGVIEMGGFVKVTGISEDETTGTLEPDLLRSPPSDKAQRFPCFSNTAAVRLDGDSLRFLNDDGTPGVEYTRE